MMLAESVRRLSHDLHPDVLRHVGLAAALRAYCADLSVAPLVVTCSTEGEFDSVHPHAAVCLYRIAQEALHNVVKHAHASHAHVRLARELHDAELTIADDGRGFNLQTGRNGSGLGLVSITERARLSGGTVSIVASVNKGTQVRVRLPLTPASSTIAEGSVAPFAAPPDSRHAPVAHGAHGAS
jgi:two-component system sensor histidine kinase UhpB